MRRLVYGTGIGFALCEAMCGRPFAPREPLSLRRLAMTLRQILHDARSKGLVRLALSPATTKHYIHDADAVDAICALAETKASGYYNVASGENTSHVTVLESIREFFPFEWECASTSPQVTPAPIHVDRLRSLGLPKARSFRQFFPLYMREYLIANS